MFTFFRNPNPSTENQRQAMQARQHEAEQAFAQVFGEASTMTPPVSQPMPQQAPQPMPQPSTQVIQEADMEYIREMERHHNYCASANQPEQPPHGECVGKECHKNEVAPAPIHPPGTNAPRFAQPIDAQIDFTKPFEFSDFMRSR